MKVDKSGPWIVFDLDGTVLFPAESESEMRVITSREGRPSSAIPADILLFLQSLSTAFSIVAITSRRRSSFDRVVLPGVPYAWAGTSHGGELLKWGTSVDRGWQRRVMVASATFEGALKTLSDELDLDDKIRPQLVGADGVGPIYLRCAAGSKRSIGNILCLIRRRIDLADWELSVTGTDIHVVPRAVCKGALVRYLCEEHFCGRSPVIAMGDGLADLGLLRQARLAATPVGSHLWDLAMERIDESN